MENPTEIRDQRKTQKCPLCDSVIPYEKWLKVIGAWEQKKKALEESKQRLLKLKEQEAALRGQKKILKAKMKEQALKAKAVAEKKIEIQKKKAEATSLKMQRKFERERTKIEKQAKKIAQENERKKLGSQLQKKDHQIKSLQQHIERLKKGITPQIDGFEFEKKVVKELRELFLEDEFIHRGKEGDILHIVKIQTQEVGKILYELKNTEKYELQFVEQIRVDKNSEKANYGVLVSWQNPKSKQGFSIDGDIIIVHPFGLLDIATFLRAAIIEVYKSTLTQQEANEKGKEILRFMQSENYKTLVDESISQSIKAAEMLKKEVRSHISAWHDRYHLYGTIFKNISQVKYIIHGILTTGKSPETLPELSFTPLQLPNATDLCTADLKKKVG